jgi:transitional endoplasmic reticulum ATPase
MEPHHLAQRFLGRADHEGRMTLTETTPAPTLPAWAEELKERYLRGESSQFVVHGNVHDVVLWGGKLLGVAEFLSQELFSKSKEAVLLYNLSRGIRYTKQSAATQGHH